MKTRRNKKPPKMRSKRDLINRHPVAYLYAKDEIESCVRSLKVQIWVRYLGEEATDCLARLGWLIGLAAETELQAVGITQRLRTLHGTLRMLQSWCLSGYTWQIADPAGIDNTLDLAYAALMDAPATATAMIPGAEMLAASIRAHTVTPESITGAELYQDDAEVPA